MCTWLTVLSGLVVVGQARGDDGLDVDEAGAVEVLPGVPGPHWVWVYDAALNAMPDGRAYLVDADSGNVLGSLNTGFSWVALTLPGTQDAIYSSETYYSRHTRGIRTDLVSAYDPVTLSVRAEIPLPPKRASTIPRLNDSALTDDGRFMAVFNLTPATSLSIVDVKDKVFIEEAPIPGCSLAFPSGNRTFFSLCFHGGALLTELNDDGSVSRQKVTNRIFDAEGDFIADNGSRLGADWYFASLNGNMYRLGSSGGEVKLLETWPFVSSAELAANWRVSGFQGSAIHVPSSTLFLLVHQGPVDTYKDPGTHVWVYDVKSKRRVRELKLSQPATGIAVSQDGDPILVGVNMDGGSIAVYSALDGELRRVISELGRTPALAQFPWQPGIQELGKEGEKR